MLTGDLNVLEVRWIVQYQIKDPVHFLFRVRDQRDTIRDISEAVMRRVVGDYSVDEVLTIKRAEIDVQAQEELQRILDSYGAGIQIVTLKLQDVTPPDRVQPAFNEVNEAKQEKERMINQAWEAYNKVIPKAKGEAEKTVREAEGYAVAVVNRAKGEAQRFLATWEAYRQAPEVTRKRLYLDAMAAVLATSKQKYVIDPSQQALLPFLQLQKGAE
jgi:membrane protease subunit HflK